jgi:hypothetical protein
MKTCTCCEQEKPLDEFKIACDRSSGYHSICKACAAMKQRNIRPVHGTPEYVQMLTASREHYAINKVKIRARRKARRLELKHMAWVQAQRSQALADVIVPDDAVNEFPVKVIEVVAPIPRGLFEAPIAVSGHECSTQKGHG